MEFYSQGIEINTNKLKPCYKSILELERYLIDEYAAQIIEASDERTRKFIKYDVVNEKLPHLLEFDISKVVSPDKEYEQKLLNELDRIDNLSKEKLNLDIVRYIFDIIVHECAIGKFDVIIERTTEYVNTSFQLLYNDDDYKDILFKVMGKIQLFQGVTQEDIDNKSERYYRYITTKDYYKI